MKGNAHYEENNYAEAMVWYTASLALAPRENVEYGLTIANRSAVLYDLKRYKVISCNSKIFIYFPYVLFRSVLWTSREFANLNIPNTCYTKYSYVKQIAT